MKEERYEKISMFVDKDEKIDFDYQVEITDNIEVNLGDVFVLGEHLVMCGDATNKEHVSKLMGSNVANLWLTDPPYNVAYEGGTIDKMTIQNDEMDNDSFRLFLRDSFKNVFDYLDVGSSYYIFHADTEGYNFRGALFDVGLSLRQTLIWVKNSLVLGRQDYHWQHEPILYGWKDGASHRWFNDRKQTTVLNFDKPARNELHPTMKPIDLTMYLIKNSSEKGDIVIDTFGGSGSTLIACEYTNRRARLMELDPFYVSVIINRWMRFTGKRYVRL